MPSSGVELTKNIHFMVDVSSFMGLDIFVFIQAILNEINMKQYDTRFHLVLCNQSTTKSFDGPPSKFLEQLAEKRCITGGGLNYERILNYIKQNQSKNNYFVLVIAGTNACGTYQFRRNKPAEKINPFVDENFPQILLDKTVKGNNYVLGLTPAYKSGLASIAFEENHIVLSTKHLSNALKYAMEDIFQRKIRGYLLPDTPFTIQSTNSGAGRAIIILNSLQRYEHDFVSLDPPANEKNLMISNEKLDNLALLIGIAKILIRNNNTVNFPNDTVFNIDCLRSQIKTIKNISSRKMKEIHELFQFIFICMSGVGINIDLTKNNNEVNVHIKCLQLIQKLLSSEQTPNEIEIDEFISEFEQKIPENYSEECFITLNNYAECIKENAVLCIGVYVTKPNTIHDTEKCQEVGKTYISDMAFMQANELLIGCSREKINAIIPLYICEDHWKLVKLKGYYRTFELNLLLDAFGIASLDKTNFGLRLSKYISETCKYVIELQKEIGCFAEQTNVGKRILLDYHNIYKCPKEIKIIYLEKLYEVYNKKTISPAVLAGINLQSYRKEYILRTKDVEDVDSLVNFFYICKVHINYENECFKRIYTEIVKSYKREQYLYNHVFAELYGKEVKNSLINPQVVMATILGRLCNKIEDNYHLHPEEANSFSKRIILSLIDHYCLSRLTIEAADMDNFINGSVEMAARSLLGIKKGRNFMDYVKVLQTKKCTHAMEKINLIVTGRYHHHYLFCDKGPAHFTWYPSAKNMNKLVLNNRQSDDLSIWNKMFYTNYYDTHIIHQGKIERKSEYM
jgi:hypothetical protein